MNFFVQQGVKNSCVQPDLGIGVTKVTCKWVGGRSLCTNPGHVYVKGWNLCTYLGLMEVACKWGDGTSLFPSGFLHRVIIARFIRIEGRPISPLIKTWDNPILLPSPKWQDSEINPLPGCLAHGLPLTSNRYWVCFSASFLSISRGHLQHSLPGYHIKDLPGGSNWQRWLLSVLCHLG